jgi:hypothetical protein
MAESLPRLATVGEIARRFSVHVHQVDHVIDTRNVQPIGRAGNAYVYSDADVEFIGMELRRIARERESVGAA